MNVRMSCDVSSIHRSSQQSDSVVFMNIHNHVHHNYEQVLFHQMMFIFLESKFSYNIMMSNFVNYFL